jgi:hypothetical protein
MATTSCRPQPEQAFQLRVLTRKSGQQQGDAETNDIRIGRPLTRNQRIKVSSVTDRASGEIEGVDPTIGRRHREAVLVIVKSQRDLGVRHNLVKIFGEPSIVADGNAHL